MSDPPPENQADSKAETPLAYRAARSGLWIVGSSYWAIAFGFVANILLTRLLTPADYGQFALAGFFVALFQLRNKLGLNYALARGTQVDGKTVGTYFTVDVTLGAGGLVLTAVAAPILLTLGYSPAMVGMMLVMAILLFTESFVSVFGALLGRALHTKPGSIINSVTVVISYLPAFALALTGQGQWSLVVQWITFAIVSQVAIGAYAFAQMRPVMRLGWHFSRATARHLLLDGLIIGMCAFLAGMVAQTDNFLVGTIEGATALGFYDRAFRTAQWPSLLLNALIANAAIFTYARLQDDHAKLEKTVSMVLWICANVALPVAMAIFIAAPDFILLIYGERWLPAAPLLRVLVLVAILRPVWENTIAVFTATGKLERVLLILALQIAILFGLGWLLTGRFGSMGTAVAVGITFVLALALLLAHQERRLASIAIKTFAMPVLAASMTALLYLAANQVFDADALALWVRVLAKMTYAVVMFFLVLWIIQPKETRSRITYILRLIRGQQQDIR
jgi:lipopolysaccharide exporter